MKKIWLILIGFLILIITISSIGYTQKVIKTNKYPELENKKYRLTESESVWISQKNYVKGGEFTWDANQKDLGNGLIFAHNNCNPMESNKECKFDYQFICVENKENAKKIKFSSYNILWLIDVWGTEYIIDCEYAYWIYVVNDVTGPLGKVYGPFPPEKS